MSMIDQRESEIAFNFPGFIIYTLSAILVGFGLCFLVSCGPVLETGDAIYQKSLEGTGCEPATTRCLGSQLQTCQADHTWATNADCVKYEPSRACYTKAGKLGCYRPEDKTK
jgi:hypothetical protein